MAGNPSNPDLPEDEFADVRRDLVGASFGLSLSPSDLEPGGEEALRRFREMLAVRIGEMLDAEYEQLLAALYRLDVPEEKAQAAFLLNDRSAIAGRLAEIVVERQVERVRTRHERGA